MVTSQVPALSGLFQGKERNVADKVEGGGAKWSRTAAGRLSRQRRHRCHNLIRVALIPMLLRSCTGTARCLEIAEMHMRPICNLVQEMPIVICMSEEQAEHDVNVDAGQHRLGQFRHCLLCG